MTEKSKKTAKKWTPTPQSKEEKQAKLDGILESAAKRIIDIIALGKTSKWHKAWQGSPLFDRPYNPVTGHKLTGFNRFLIMMEMLEHDTNDGRVLTFNELGKFSKEHGTECRIKKGEKVIYLLRPTFINKQTSTNDTAKDGENKSEGEGMQKIVFFTPYAVFHAHQIDGMPNLPVPAAPNWEKDTFIDDLVLSSEAELRHGGDKAYCKRGGHIQLPWPSDFESKEDYYAAKLHEWYHWTGHEPRENRVFGQAFGDEAYAIEELRAESFSVMAGMALGLPLNIDNHAAYIKSWSEKLGSSQGVKEIIRCMNEAGKMLDVVLDIKNEATPAIEWWPENSVQKMN